MPIWLLRLYYDFVVTVRHGDMKVHGRDGERAYRIKNAIRHLADAGDGKILINGKDVVCTGGMRAVRQAALNALAMENLLG